MRTVQFDADLTAKGVVAIPPDLASELSLPARARVIVIVGDEEDEADWRALSYEQFLRSYSEEDSIYDDYDAHQAR